MIPAALLLITSLFFFLKLIILIVCSFKDSQNYFMQYLSLYTSFIFSMYSNDCILNIEKCDGKFSLTFVVDELLFRFILIYINLCYYKLKICINNKWGFMKFLILMQLKYIHVFRRHNHITKIFILT